MTSLVLVGLSHHVAPVELRETVALDPDAAGALAERLAAVAGEAVCLSTCNRTELYLAADDPAAAEALAATALADLAGQELDVLYRLADEAAATHLFRVAAGLDSLVPGEGEILGQVRTAYERGAAGPLLDRVFRQALHAGKRVRHETAIAESPASVSSAAAALAQQVFGDLAGRRVLLVGAGKIGEQAADNLRSRGASIAFVANRTVANGAGLAERFGGEPVALDALEQAVALADVVVTSTSAPGFVLGREEVARSLAGRRGRPLLLVDIAVPRDVDPAVGGLGGCYLYDIDDLEAVVAETLSGRRAEAGRAEAIVAEEAARFRDWQAALDVVPAIASLRARVEEIRERELERVRGRLSDAERVAVESVTARLVDKLLHLPTVRMKEAAAASDGAAYADAVRHLFGLGDEERRR
ncbi:MAG TPA: glutamyl-tRNA reductase [Gaiellaceae bacterium]|nr:glutamyl-tRNA reductase [Gaiellaceae bacterium]